MNRFGTKEICYNNGCKLIFNEKAGIWESRREPRKNQGFNLQAKHSFSSITAGLNAKLPVTFLDRQLSLISGNSFNDDNENDGETEIEILPTTENSVQKSVPLTLTRQPQIVATVANEKSGVWESKREPTLNQVFKSKQNRIGLINAKLNAKLSVTLLDRQLPIASENALRNDHESESESEIEIIEIFPAKEKNAQKSVSLTLSRQQHITPIVHRHHSPSPALVNDCFRKPSNITITKIEPNAVVKVPVNHNALKPAIAKQIQSKPEVRPLLPVTIKKNDQKPLRPILPSPFRSVEPRKVIKFEKCTEPSLMCVVCRIIFKNPGDDELNSRLFGRFSCRRCHQFFTDCCNEKLNVDKFVCNEKGDCDIGGDERCLSCWFDQGFKAFDIDDSSNSNGPQFLVAGASKDDYSYLNSRTQILEEKKRKHSDVESTKSEQGSSCKFCGKYISSDYNMRVHWVHMHTDAIKDVQLPPSLERIRRQKYELRRRKQALSDEE